jgi:hypothetical protein
LIGRIGRSSIAEESPVAGGAPIDVMDVTGVKHARGLNGDED